MNIKILILVISVSILSIATFVNAQTTKTIGSSGDYTTLKAAFDAINSGNITGTIFLQITGNIVETSSAVLNASGSGSANYTTVRIYPTVTGCTISGNLATALIDLNGADNVSIDGRVNASGSTKDLIISNTSTSATSGTSTIRFINTAQQDTVKYCTIKGASTAPTGGIVYFATATSGTGNSNNMITNCNLTNDAGNRPINGIYSLGSAGYVNTSNNISNNNIYDFLNAGASSYGIYIFSYSTDFIISGNSFFETSNPFSATAANTYNAIRIYNTSGNNFTISNNYVGGREASCGGSAFTVNGNYAHLFQCIFIRVGITTASVVHNNTIKNINYTTNSSTPWIGIYIVGAVNIGTTTGNLIGASSGNGSIIFTNTAASSASYAIYIAGSGNVNIQNNTIGSITTIGSTSYSHSIVAIYKSNVAGNLTVSNNTIGSTSTTNSIQASSASTSATGQEVTGIRSLGSGSVTISDNTIVNLYNADAGTDMTSITRGIYASSGSNTIQNNTIRNICSTSAQAFYNVSGSVIGIAQASTVTSSKQTISGNTIFNLTNTNSTAKVNVYGIYFAGTTVIADNNIYDNFIYGLSVLSSNTNGSVFGINTYTGASTIYNNIINFGGSVATDITIFGIYAESGSNNNIYFNTVYIGGTSNGTGKSTYALYDKNNSLARDYRNNILFNARSSGGTGGTHYSIFLTGKTNLTIDNNDYYVSTAGTLGKIGSTDYSALDASWKTASGGDVNSLNTNPGFMIGGSTTPADYMPATALAGLTGLGIILDILGVSRPTVPTMGALERGPFWVGSTSTDFNTASNWSNNAVPASGINIFFADNPDRSCYLDMDRTVRAIIINQGTDKFVVNGHKLTIIGTLALSNAGQIDASATSSTLELAGSSVQPIPSGAFYNDEVYSLNINNTNNITFSGNLRLLNSVTAISGQLDAITNSPTLIYAGSSVQTIESGLYLNDRFYNLSIDNSVGVTLNTNFIINNNLIINSGKIFEIAAVKTLTVAGSINNSAGNAGFVLQSDATGTAVLIHNTNSVPGTVKHYISGNAEDWHFLSSPVSGQSISGNWLPSGTYGNGTGYDLYLWNEANSCWIYKLDTTSAINWNTVHSGANFASSRGYLYSVQASNPTKEFAGNLNNGTINYGLTFSSDNISLKGFNLVGNPYPSSIDWKAASGWTRTNLKSSGGGFDMWIWNPEASNYGIYNSADADGVGTNSVTRYIAPMQGFFVQASSTGNLGMNNSIRVLDGADWFKNAQVDEVNKLSVCIKSDDGYGSDEVQVKFGYSENENGAMKLFSKVISAPSLYMSSAGINLSVRYFTNTQDNPSVSLTFKSGIDGNYTIDCNFDQQKFDTIILEDKKMHTIQNMKVKKTYSFQSASSDNSNRFVLHFGRFIKQSDNKELPVKIYTDGNQLIVDLTLINKETNVLVYDIMGRLLLSEKLQGETQHKLNLNSDTKILIVKLTNPDGSLYRKLLWEGS